MSQFKRYIGVDYSGAETPESSLKGLRAYAAEPAKEPYEFFRSYIRPSVIESIGHGEGLQNGSRMRFPPDHLLWSECTTAFHFRLSILGCTTRRSIGPPFLTTSNATGRQIKRISMSISCAMGIAATAPCAAAEQPGGESLKDLAGKNRSSISTCGDPHQHDVYSIAAWLRNANRDGSFARFLDQAPQAPS